MSNYRAIATVTAVIRDLLLESQIHIEGSSVSVKTYSTDFLKTLTGDTLNLFLYQVTPNSSYRNHDLPTRSQNGKILMAKPQLALDLHYLLTSYSSSNDELKAQLMLAKAMLFLHENAVVPHNRIVETITNPTKNQGEEFLADSDLSNQVETIKVSLQPLSIEELTKLWSAFFQTSYRISASYVVSVVLLESQLQPTPSLPVSKRQLRVFPLKQPIIESVEPQILMFDPTKNLSIKGRNLSSDIVIVRLNGSEIAITDRRNVSENQINLLIPADSTAGVKQVQVVQKFVFDASDEKGHRGYESNVAAFVLTPNLKTISPTTVNTLESVTMNFDPGITSDQKVNVLLGDYVLTVDLPSAGSVNYPLTSLVVKIPANIKAGEYRVRLRVNGADSLPRKDESDVIHVSGHP